MRVRAVDDYTVEVIGEKHTVLNLVRWCIVQFEADRAVELVGYTIPHPMEDKALVKIQLRDERWQTPKEILGVFLRGIESSQKLTAHLAALVGPTG